MSSKPRPSPPNSSQADVIGHPEDVTGISLVWREAGPKFLLTRPASGGFGLAVETGRGPGPCTPPAGYAVGAAGPAMSGGQLMAGVGQCQRIGSWYPRYGAGAYAVGPAPSNPYYGAPNY